MIQRDAHAADGAPLRVKIGQHMMTPISFPEPLGDEGGSSSSDTVRQSSKSSAPDGPTPLEQESAATYRAWADSINRMRDDGTIEPPAPEAEPR